MQGYSQVKGIDFGETFAPVLRLESIHILLAYAAHHNFKLQQMDVESAFLNVAKDIGIRRIACFGDSVMATSW